MAMMELFLDPKACWPSLLIGRGELGAGETTVPLAVALGHQLSTCKLKDSRQRRRIYLPSASRNVRGSIRANTGVYALSLR